MIYAQINEDKICTALVQPHSPIYDENLIEVASFDGDYLNRKYDDGAWSTIKYDIKTNVPLNELEAIKQENKQLEQALLEAKTLIANQEQKNMQNEQAILELTTIIGGMM